VILTRVVPAPAVSRPIDAPDFRDWVTELYQPDRAEWLRLNLIASVNGSATGRDGTSESLSNRMDRRILGVMRDISDVVLVGASTVRAEGYVRPRRAALAVVTRTGDLGGHRLDPDVSRGALLIVCPRGLEDRVRRAVGIPDARILGVEAEGADLAPAAVVRALRAEGFASIVCEGGPHLAGALMERGVVDELCLSTSPTLVSPGLQLVPPGRTAEVDLSLRQLLVDEQGTLYARWSVPAAPARS
jgi:riboflavin biosynthesis pyrimidine reductase